MYVTVLWICAGLAAAVFAVMLYSIAAFRQPPGTRLAQYRHSKLVEVLWAIVPIVILVGMAAPAVKTLVGLDPAGPSAACRPAGSSGGSDVKECFP